MTTLALLTISALLIALVLGLEHEAAKRERKERQWHDAHRGMMG